MTITRHDVTATTTDLVAGWHPVYGRGYFLRAPDPVWADPTDTVGYPSWHVQAAGMTAAAVTDLTGAQVIEVTAGPSTQSPAMVMRYGVPPVAPGLYRLSAFVYNPTAVPVRVEVGMSFNDAVTWHVAHPGQPFASPVGYTEVWGIYEVTGTPVTTGWARVSMLRYDSPPDTATTIRVAGFSITPVTYSDVLDLRPSATTITLDESWTPYVRATLTCPMPQDDVLDRIDPRTLTRVRVSIARASADSYTVAAVEDVLGGTVVGDLSSLTAGPPPWTVANLTSRMGDAYEDPPRSDLDDTRTFDLQLRSRSVDWVAGTMTLELTSDEMALQDFARFEEITDRFTPPTTTSLVVLVNWALGFLGASLAPGALDATIDSSSVIWNLGEELWDFLDAHVRASNRRLWCDERRRWRLTEPFTGTTGSTVTVDRPTILGDTLTRGEGYADTTVVIYEWVDAAGAQQRAYGYADWSSVTGGQPVTLVRRIPTRGTVPKASDAAAGLRRRAATRGRAVLVEAVADPAATPGAPLIVAGYAAQVRDAMVSAVTWSYPDDVMTIRTRDAATT